MKKSDLIQKLASEANIPLTRAKQFVDLVFDSMSEELASGGKVEIRGLASWTTKSYKGYIGRNPKTGDAVSVKPKRGIVFRASKELREHLKPRE